MLRPLAPSLALALALLAGSAAAAEPAQLVAKGAHDLALSGGAAIVNEGFDTCLRSGSPHQSPIAALRTPLSPGATVRSLSFAFEYTAGWSGAAGSNFSVAIGSTVLYASGTLDKYSYKKAAPGDYSPPILAQATGLSIALPRSGAPSHVELRFQNNDRNVQLRLPLVFNLTCDGPCVAAPPPPPPPPPPRPPPPPPPWTPMALFVDGNRDQHNRSWACVRGAALLRSPDRTLLAFGGGKSNCADASVGNSILLRRSVDNGSSWSPVESVVVFNETGGYVAPIVDTKRCGNVSFLRCFVGKSECLPRQAWGRHSKS
jgi:hypothetical protein